MWLTEIRRAYQNLSRAQGFTLAAVASIALGICGNATIFSMVNAILIRPLPYGDAERLVTIQLISPKFRSSIGGMPAKGIHIRNWRNEVKSLEAIESITSGGRPVRNLDGPGEPERVGSAQITAGFLDLLGAKPQLGRWFSRAEEERAAPAVAIIGDSLWRRHFSADPTILGKRILFEGNPVEVVGIAPPGLHLFRGQQLQAMVALPSEADVITPVRLRPGEVDGSEPNFDYAALARVKPGKSLEDVRAEMDRTLAAMRRERPEALELHPLVQRLAETLTANSRRPLTILLSAVGVVLLIVCVNLTNLMLVRGSTRTRELGIRAAIGATKRQLIRQSLAESALLAVGGTVIGVLLSAWTIAFVVARAPIAWAGLGDTAMDSAVIVFAAALCILTTVLVGVLPAWQASHASPLESLPKRGQTDGPRAGRARAVLVGVEVALTTGLLIGAGLLLGSLQRVLSADRGFATEEVLTAELCLSSGTYQTAAQQQEFYRDLLERARMTPGVRQIGYVDTVPLAPAWDVIPVITEDRLAVTRLEDSAENVAVWIQASSGYFAAAGIPLRAGRLFRDEGEPELVAVMNKSAAQRLWPGEDPIGKRFRHPLDRRWIRLVGVVGDTRQEGLDRISRPTIYWSYFQHGGAQLSLVMSFSLHPGALARGLREDLWNVDRTIAAPEVRRMATMVKDSVAPRQFQAFLLGAFALLALSLASIGIFGVASHVVVQRRGEIGVRLALGALPAEVSSLILRRGMRPVVAGLAIGLAASAGATRLIVSQLFEARALDPATFIAAPAILGVVAAVACYLPARRASHLDPLTVLRFE